MFVRESQVARVFQALDGARGSLVVVNVGVMVAGEIGGAVQSLAVGSQQLTTLLLTLLTLLTSRLPLDVGMARRGAGGPCGLPRFQPRPNPC